MFRQMRFGTSRALSRDFDVEDMNYAEVVSFWPCMLLLFGFRCVFRPEV